MNWIEVIQEFEGIIGALGGVIATLLVSHFIRNAGTVKLHSQGFNISSSSGGPEPYEQVVNTMSDAFEAFELKGTILFENTSENTKAIHNIKLEFHTDGDVKHHVLQDVTTIRRHGGGISYDIFTHLNLPPKEMLSIDTRMRSNPALVNYKHRISEVFLSYEIADKKIFKKKQVKMDVL